MDGETWGTMRAVMHRRYGDPQRVLQLADSLPVLAAGRGEVSIRVSAVPVHPGDLLGIRGGSLEGESSTSPRIPGVEGVGVIAAVGSEVDGLALGQRVAFFPVPGAWAEYVTTSAADVVPLPDGVSDATAALLLVNPLTALMLLRAVGEAWAGPPRPFVQTAAGSSVARLVAAAAERHGYRLVNVVRSAEGAALLRERFPSMPAIATVEPDWPVRLRDALGGAASVVLDAVGGALATELLGSLEDGGTLISYGMLSGPATSLDLSRVVGHELRVRGVSIGRWSRLSPELRAADVAFALSLAQDRPDLFAVAATYDLADFAAAIDEAGRPGKTGAVLLTSPASHSRPATQVG